MTQFKENPTKTDVFEYYKIKDLDQLEQLFVIRFSEEPKNIDDSYIFHSFKLVLDSVSENNYNTLQETILIFNIVAQGVYGVTAEEFGFITNGLGVFNSSLLLENIFNDNKYYQHYLKLYNSFLDRYSNTGMIIVKEGKKLVERIVELIEGLDPEIIKKLSSEFMSKAEELGLKL